VADKTKDELLAHIAELEANTAELVSKLADVDDKVVNKKNKVLTNQVKNLTKSNDELRLINNKLIERLEAIEGPAVGPAPKGSFVIDPDDPYFDAAMRDFGVKSEAVKKRARGLVLSPDDPRSVEVLKMYLVRCQGADPKRADAIRAIIKKFE
jgi:uncharacterized coiled-coil protein SlyX